MPKLKTKKSVSKKVKITKTGKVMRGRQYASHRRLFKSKSRIRRFKEPGTLTGQNRIIVKNFVNQ